MCFLYSPALWFLQFLDPPNTGAPKETANEEIHRQFTSLCSEHHFLIFLPVFLAVILLFWHEKSIFLLAVSTWSKQHKLLFFLKINFLEFLGIDVQSPLRIVLILEFFPPNANLLDICKRHPQSTCYRKNEIQCSFKWTWNISKTFCIVIGESIVKKRQNKGFSDVN